MRRWAECGAAHPRLPLLVALAALRLFRRLQVLTRRVRVLLFVLLLVWQLARFLERWGERKLHIIVI